MAEKLRPLAPVHGTGAALLASFVVAAPASFPVQSATLLRPKLRHHRAIQ
jgi:hypothetical protein